MFNWIKRKTLKYKIAELEFILNKLQEQCELNAKQTYILDESLIELKDKFKTLDDYIASRPWK